MFYLYYCNHFLIDVLLSFCPPKTPSLQNCHTDLCKASIESHLLKSSNGFPFQSEYNPNFQTWLTRHFIILPYLTLLISSHTPSLHAHYVSATLVFLFLSYIGLTPITSAFIPAGFCCFCFSSRTSNHFHYSKISAKGHIF